MRSTARCEHCNLSHSICDSILCFSCLQYFASPRWMGCTRCGMLACGGNCGGLNWLSSVCSIFPYAGRHRALLLAAKDIQNPVSIAIFSEAYCYVATHALAQILKKNEIEIVLLARWRIQRLAASQWHPNNFWVRCLQDAFAIVKKGEAGIACEKAPVCMFPGIALKRRALIDARSRREKLVTENIVIIDSENHRFSGAQSLNALVLDDVLTSGGALKREWTDLQAAMQAKCNVQLHALTLFRTPAASIEE